MEPPREHRGIIADRPSPTESEPPGPSASVDSRSGVDLGWSERLVIAAAIVSALVMLATMAVPMWQRKVYVADDLGLFHLPTRAYFQRCLLQGFDPSWWPQVFGGFDLHGEGQVGMAHPWHRLLYGRLPLDVAFNLELIASYPLFLVGMIAVSRRRWGLPWIACLAGGWIASLSGFPVAHAVHPHAVAIFAHTPWLLLAQSEAIRNGSPRGRWLAVAAIALLTGSQLLLGYPQYVWYSLLIQGLALLADGGGVSWTGCFRIITGWALGLGLGAAQWLPTWDALRLSSRGERTIEFLGRGSLHPWHWLQPIAPYLAADRVLAMEAQGNWGPHELSTAQTVLVPVLAAWAIARRNSLGTWRRLAAWCWLVIGIGVALALGKYAPWFPWLVSIPPFSLFRGSARAICIVHLATSILSTVAIADLAGLARRREPMASNDLPWRSLGLVAAVSWSIAAIALARGDFAGRPIDSWREVLLGPLLISLAAAGTLLAARGRMELIGLLLLLSTWEQVSHAIPLWKQPRPRTIEQWAAIQPGPPNSPLGSEPGFQRIAPLERPNVATLSGWSILGGYVALKPSVLQDPEDRTTQASWNVTWKEEQPRPDLLQPTGSPHASWVRTATTPRGRAWLSAVPAKAAERDLENRAKPLGEVVVLEDQPGRVRIFSQSAEPANLIVSERFHPGWRGTIRAGGVDQGASPMRWSGELLAIGVPAGLAETTMEFQPRSTRVGSWISWTSLAVVLTLAVSRCGLTWRRRWPWCW